MADRRLLIIAYTDPRRQTRVWAAAKAAQDAGFDVHAVGFDYDSLERQSNLKQRKPLPKIYPALKNQAQFRLIEPRLSSYLDKAQMILPSLAARGISSLGFKDSRSSLYLSYFLPKVKKIYEQVNYILSSWNNEREITDKDSIFISSWTFSYVKKLISRKYPKINFIYDQAELSVTELSENYLWNFAMPSIIRNSERYLIDSSNYLTSVIPNQKIYLHKHLHYIKSIPEDKFHFIPNAYESGEIISKTNNVKNSLCSFLYLGAVRPFRGLEVSVMALQYLPHKVVFRIQGQGSDKYKNELKDLAASINVENRLFFTDAVASNKIPPSIEADSIGICILSGHTDQLKYAQPNKVFQYFSAGIPILVSRGSLLDKQIGLDSKFGYSVDMDCTQDNAAINLAQKIDLLLRDRNSHSHKENLQPSFLKKISGKSFSDFFVALGKI